MDATKNTAPGSQSDTANEQCEGAYYITGCFGNFDGKEENLTAKLEIKITNKNFQPGDAIGMLYLLGRMFAKTHLLLEEFLEGCHEKWEFKDNQWMPYNNTDNETP